MRSKRLINKQHKKRIEGKCVFCAESNYACLEVHRILEGMNGGKYEEANCITCCNNCHAKIHSGQIRTDRKYYSTCGTWILHYWDENGKEEWLELKL